MNSSALILWIIAYTLTGADILLGFISYLQNKQKEISAFLLLLLNLFGITLISFLFSMSLINLEVFNLLLQNALLLLYLVLPNILYKVYKIPFSFKRYFLFYLAIACIINLLFFLKIQVIPYFYIIFWIPFFINGVVVNKAAKEHNLSDDDRGNPLYFYRSIKSTWNLTGIIAALMGILSLMFFLLPIPVDSDIYSSFFAGFYCLYCLPSLIYFLRFHLKPEGSNERDAFHELTEREKEVAELIIEGKKYREIGEILFISLSTVKKHANSIYRKTHTANGRQLIQKKINSRKF